METRTRRVAWLAALMAATALGAPRKNNDQPRGPSPGELRVRAIEVIIESAAGNDPALRSNAVEAMQADPARALPLIDRALTDENAGVRFAAAVSAGMLKFRDLAPAVRPLLDDQNPSVRAAGLFALHVLGQDVDLTPLADMLASQDPPLRGNVALLLGLMGDGTAIPMLKRAARQTMPRASVAQGAVVRVQIAEAMARLGDNSALDALRAGVYSQYHEVRVLAITAMGAVGDRSMEVALANIIDSPDAAKPKGGDAQVAALLDRSRGELALAAAGALARMGSAKGMDVTLKRSLSAEPVLRAQAAWVMGWMSDPRTLGRLGELLGDPAQQVRVAAAAAVMRRTK